MNKTNILFIKVPDNRTKIWYLCDRIKVHFHLNERIQITVPNQEAAKYVDDLLWKFPEESFLPHRIVDGPTSERIAITISQNNVNQSTVLFNLLPQAHPHFEQFTTLYEFYDETHPSKAELSQQRLAAYPHSSFIN